MSKMRKQSHFNPDGYGYRDFQPGQGIWLDKGLPWVFDFQYSGNSVRTVRDGKSTPQDNNTYEGDSHMSELRQSFLVLLRTLGNHSGCHQLPERSFFYKGKQFPVCARCTGVFFGHLTALLLLPFHRVVPVKWAAALLGTMGIDWGLQETGIKESTNRRRLITGFAGGLGLYSLYIQALRLILKLFRRSR